MNSYVIDEFLKLAAIDSPSKKEGELAQYIKEKIKALGAEVIEDGSAQKTGSDTGNIIARLKGTKHGSVTVLLSAHMDTITPTAGMTPQIREGKIYSDGRHILGADDKAGIAVILAVLKALSESTEEFCSVEILLTVQEEIGLIGVKNLDYKLQADYGYILDGDGPVGTVINAAPSHMTLDLVVDGKAAHAGLCPEAGINAIVVASKAISALETGRIDFETTSNFGLITGGKGRNIVADRVEIKAEVRSRDENKLEQEVQKLLRMFKETADNYRAVFTFTGEMAYEAFTIDQNHPVIAHAIKAGKSLGIEIQTKATGGGLDANILNSRHIPCVALGLGNENPHTNEEFLSIAELEKSVDFILAILHEAARGDESLK